MKKRLFIKIITFVLALGFAIMLTAAASDHIRFNEGEKNLSNTMRLFAGYVQYFGVGSMFLGVITYGMAYRSDSPTLRQKGIIMTIIGAACTQSTLILTAAGLII